MPSESMVSIKLAFCWEGGAEEFCLEKEWAVTTGFPAGSVPYGQLPCSPCLCHRDLISLPTVASGTGGQSRLHSGH